jgi:hypothetical protein
VTSEESEIEDVPKYLFLTFRKNFEYFGDGLSVQFGVKGGGGGGRGDKVLCGENIFFK